MSTGTPAWPLGPFGLWTSALDRQPAPIVRRAVAEIERLGFSALWFGEASRREAFVNAGLLLSASTRLVVASGIANIWVRDPSAMAAGQLGLLEAFDGRFLLGLGVSHDALLAPRGHRYERPLPAMRAYLDAMDLAVYDAPAPPPGSRRRVLAALGPRMLELAAERADGAHPFLVPPEHTEAARQILGAGKWLCPEVTVVLAMERSRAREVARRFLGRYLELPNYRSNLARLGYRERDLTGGGTDRLVDALVACGEGAAVRRARAHLEAGADHVALQVLSEDPSHLPRQEWQALAEALRTGSSRSPRGREAKPPTGKEREING